MERHLDRPELARPLAQLCQRTGQAGCAFLFGEIWRSSARSQSDLSYAERFLTELKAAGR